ncbi:MAG: hypothetical protein V7L23_30025 [Nostoc sp.]|uniref:hypothetical protein n=1 Tax=Nostoc sp. TaxID=1180 RepID=UPI002FEEA4C6
MNLKISSKQKYLILTVLIIVGVIACLQLNIRISGDWVAIAGLSFALWQILIAVNGAEEGRIDKLREAIAKLEEAALKRDFYHDQVLSQVQRELTMLTTQFEHHQETHGHKGLTDEVLRMKDRIAELGAALAGLARSAEVTRRLEKLEKRFGDRTSLLEPHEKT